MSGALAPSCYVRAVRGHLPIPRPASGENQRTLRTVGLTCLVASLVACQAGPSAKGVVASPPYVFESTFTPQRLATGEFWSGLVPRRASSAIPFPDLGMAHPAAMGHRVANMHITCFPSGA